jgi:hypothetical protein
MGRRGCSKTIFLSGSGLVSSIPLILKLGISAIASTIVCIGDKSRVEVDDESGGMEEVPLSSWDKM